MSRSIEFKLYPGKGINAAMNYAIVFAFVQAGFSSSLCIPEGEGEKFYKFERGGRSDG